MCLVIEKPYLGTCYLVSADLKVKLFHRSQEHESSASFNTHISCRLARVYIFHKSVESLVEVLSKC